VVRGVTISSCPPPEKAIYILMFLVLLVLGARLLGERIEKFEMTVSTAERLRPLVPRRCAGYDAVRLRALGLSLNTGIQCVAVIAAMGLNLCIGTRAG